MTVFAGIDLAWSGRKPTGVCVLKADSAGIVSLVELRCSPADADAGAIFAVMDGLGPDVVAGVDAPLIVGESRRAEAELARVFGRQGVYAYSARHDFLERHRIAEGPRLGSMLTDGAWNLDPVDFVAGARGRHAFEVFPHATIVSLFGAARALKYKKGRRAARLGPMAEFQALMRGHVVEDLGCLSETLTAAIEMLPTRELKAVEDQLDAIACAISAYHIWKHGAAGVRVFGDAGQGYIAVPLPVTSSPAPPFP